MKRNYASGSHKRKAAIEKKSKTESLIAKIPKLPGLFRQSNERTAVPPVLPEESRPSTSGVESASDNTLRETETVSSEIEPPTDENAQDHESTPATDPAFWQMESGLIHLQSYWARHGEF